MSGKYVGWDQVLKQGHVALMKGIIDIGAHAGQTKRTSVALLYLPSFSISIDDGFYINRQTQVWGCGAID